MVGYEKWRLIFRNSFSLGIIFEIRGEDRFISCTKEYAVSKPEGGGRLLRGRCPSGVEGWQPLLADVDRFGVPIFLI